MGDWTKDLGLAGWIGVHQAEEKGDRHLIGRCTHTQSLISRSVFYFFLAAHPCLSPSVCLDHPGNPRGQGQCLPHSIWALPRPVYLDIQSRPFRPCSRLPLQAGRFLLLQQIRARPGHCPALEEARGREGGSEELERRRGEPPAHILFCSCWDSSLPF